MNKHQTNELQTNKLQQTTINALYISADSHEHILEPQVTGITEATNIETETTARTNINAGFQCDTTTDYASNDKVAIGRMTDVCPHCLQCTDMEERTTNTLLLQWKGETPTHQDPPLILKRLLEENIAISKHFRSNIKKYNFAFQMTSLGTEHNLTNHGLFTTFKIQGQCYHKIGDYFQFHMKNLSLFKCISWEIH